MIPYLLAAVGGYLIGQSRKDEQYADGGMMADGGGVGYENWQMVVVSKELQKDGGRYHKDRFLVSARNIEEAKEIATKLWNKEFGDTDLSIVNVMSESLYRLKYIDQYADGGMMAKGGKVKNKKWIQEALTGDEGSLRRTAKRKGLLRGDENLSMTDLKKLQKMGGKTGKRAHLAQTLRKFDKGGMEDYYEDLRVYVQGVGTIYQGNSLAEATDVFDKYYDNNPHAEMVMVDEKYGDEIKWANVSNEYDDED